MRLTSCLLKIHNGWLFRLKWKMVSNKKILDTGVVSSLQSRGINVQDANEYVAKANRIYHLPEEPIVEQKQYPKTFVFGDGNVLVYGTKQAQVLTKSLLFNELPEKLEKKFENMNIPKDIERSMHQSVLVSHLLDAEQVKSPIRVPLSPEKPAHIIRKVYGITDARKNLLLATRLVNHCERFYGHIETVNKKIINDVKFMAPIDKDGLRFHFDLKAEMFLSSRKPIAPSKKANSNETLPDISPLSESISIPVVETDYKRICSYPIKSTSNFSHPHTVLLHYSKLDVKHLFDEQITDDQFESRAILKGFATAASRAQQIYGEDVKHLDHPIVVQVVHLDSNRIQFGVFQLNTLDLEGNSGITNYWFRRPQMMLYDECIYKDGRPSLANYNFDIFKMMCVFYSN